jgi:hypothetical protein
MSTFCPHHTSTYFVSTVPGSATTGRDVKKIQVELHEFDGRPYIRTFHFASNTNEMTEMNC